ncbi:MAG: hypothetical protein M1480_15300 [Bacteroidetes bacterium]|nr:hypothetical protein [Bacteroidota bacterium]
MAARIKNAIMRLYHFSDARLLEIMRSVKTAFHDNKAKFVEYDANFDDTFEEDFAAKLQKAEDIPSDDTVKASQKGTTATVQDNMDKCYDHVMYTERFVKKAFPDNQAVHDEFGYNRIVSIRRKQPEMILFMKDFSATSLKYQAELTAQKYPAAKIELSATLYNKILNSNSAQEDTKDKRSLSTEERIGIYNDLYTAGNDIMEAGKKIFKNDPAMKKLFTLGTKGGNGGTDTPPAPPAP